MGSYATQSDLSLVMSARIDDRIARLALRQNGNVTREQLLELGLGREAIKHRARRKRLFRVHRGVFAVGRPPQTAVERYAAAVLACGPGAALSHFSALSLWKLTDQWRMPPHVTAPTRRKRPGIITHRSSGLQSRDFRTRTAIRVTSPARTILDCARALDRQAGLGRTIADARRAKILTETALRDVVNRFPTHPGTTPLTRAIAVYTPTRSEFEDRFVRFCARYDFPTPIVNTQVAGHEADTWFPQHRIIVELDGWDFHRDHDVFNSDRDRDTDRLAAGIETVRITWDRLTHTPDREAARLKKIFDRRASERAALLSRASAPAARSAPRT
jgi:predicted transcriptional regulator of viral defense system